MIVDAKLGKATRSEGFHERRPLDDAAGWRGSRALAAEGSSIVPCTRSTCCAICSQTRSQMSMPSPTRAEPRTTSRSSRRVCGAVARHDRRSRLGVVSHELTIYGSRASARLDLCRFDGFAVEATGSLPGSPAPVRCEPGECSPTPGQTHGQSAGAAITSSPTRMSGAGSQPPSAETCRPSRRSLTAAQRSRWRWPPSSRQGPVLQYRCRPRTCPRDGEARHVGRASDGHVRDDPTNGRALADADHLGLGSSSSSLPTRPSRSPPVRTHSRRSTPCTCSGRARSRCLPSRVPRRRAPRRVRSSSSPRPTASPSPMRWRCCSPATRSPDSCWADDSQRKPGLSDQLGERAHGLRLAASGDAGRRGAEDREPQRQLQGAALLELGDDLERLFGAGDVLNDALVARGGTSTSKRARRRRTSTSHGSARGAASGSPPEGRSQATAWPSGHWATPRICLRLVAIPFVRLARIRPFVGSAELSTGMTLRVYAAILGGLVMQSFGELVGYLAGVGSGEHTVSAMELHRRRHLRDADLHIRRHMTARPACSVVIPTRDRPEHLRSCLDGIAALDYPDERLQVIVVDDSGRSATAVPRTGNRARYDGSRRPGRGAERRARTCGRRGAGVQRRRLLSASRLAGPPRRPLGGGAWPQ